jgi:hypothetical protein
MGPFRCVESMVLRAVFSGCVARRVAPEQKVLVRGDTALHEVRYSHIPDDARDASVRSGVHSSRHRAALTGGSRFNPSHSLRQFQPASLADSRVSRRSFWPARASLTTDFAAHARR